MLPLSRSSRFHQSSLRPAPFRAAFTLVDGRAITVKAGWNGLPEEQGFLRDIQAAACEQFTTVLAPGSNVTLDAAPRLDSFAVNNGSIRTAPVNQSSGPLPEDCEPTLIISIANYLLNF